MMSHDALDQITIVGPDLDRLQKLEQELKDADRECSLVTDLTQLESCLSQAASDLLVLDLRNCETAQQDQMIALVQAAVGEELTPTLLVLGADAKFEKIVAKFDSKMIDVLREPLNSALIRVRSSAMLELAHQRRASDERETLLNAMQAKLERELSWHKETERILSENERTLRSIFQSIEATGEAILITDRKGVAYYANPAFSGLTGFEVDEVFSNPADQFILIKHSTVTLKSAKAIAMERGSWQGEAGMVTKDGREYEAFLDINVVRDLNGKFDGYIYLQRDISTLKRIMHELERMARIDSLTGLFNRRYFMERLEEEMGRARRYKHPTCLLMIDLDHFKNINDTYGHAAGDHVLERTGELLRDLIRCTDIAGRYGGEELCVALPQSNLKGGTIFAERLRQTIADYQYALDKRGRISVTCSIGLVEITGNAHLQTYFNAVDEALYRAKRLGRNRVQIVE